MQSVMVRIHITIPSTLYKVPFKMNCMLPLKSYTIEWLISWLMSSWFAKLLSLITILNVYIIEELDRAIQFYSASVF